MIMIMKNIFDRNVVTELTERINHLTATSRPQWGKMSVEQMLAHCCVSYEYVYDSIHPKPNPIAKFFIKLFVKNAVVGEKPYKKNSPTGPDFIIKDSRNFETEKNRLIAYLTKTQELGAEHFDNKESHSFGKLSTSEWNTLFYKHLDHHLTQFEV
jgi:hypothetical protein